MTPIRWTALASTETIREAPPAPSAAEHLIIEAGGSRFACQTRFVRQIVPLRAAARLPGAPPFVRGVMNYRGALVTVIDLSARLRDVPVTDDGSVLLCSAGGKRFGLAVDDVYDVRALAVLTLPAAGLNGDLTRGGIVSGVGQVDDDLAPIVDLEAVAEEVFG